MARKRKSEMFSTGSDVSNLRRRGTPLNAEDAFSELFWKQTEPFFRNDPVLFENVMREVEDEPATLISLPGNSGTGEEKLIWSKLPLTQILLSALIDEEYSEETRREMYDGPQDYCLHCTSEGSPRCNCTQIESDTEIAGKVGLEIEPEEYRGLEEQNAHGGQKNQGEWQSSFQSGLISSIATNDIPYQEMNLDKRIALELQSIGLFQESVPDPAQSEDEEIKMETCKRKDEPQHQAPKNEHRFHKVEKAVFKKQKVENRKREVVAMNTLVDSASNRHIRGGVRRVPIQQLAVRPVLHGPQIRPLGQPQIQPQAQDDRDRQNAALQVQVAALQAQLGGLHVGTNNITTTKVRSRTVWSSATGSTSKQEKLKLPLTQSLLSAFIDEEDSEETNREMYDGPQDYCLHCSSEDSPRGNCTQIGSAEMQGKWD